MEAAERRSTARSELARRLPHAPESLRTDLLERAARALEPDLARAARAIPGQLPGLRRTVEHDGPGRALAALDPAASYRNGPPRVVFDKFHRVSGQGARSFRAGGNARSRGAGQG
ncbi:hypothetical protein [Streptomyces caniscabiei]|uniref:hypothetical protein n=1 Tax=Streptomyces caniscabiei TaxID=2746961 RepID=UPI000765D74B|nr:hypothetical protein [Streptomyces caniscabiei]